MSKHQHLDRPDDGVLSRGLSRRTLLRLLVTGVGASALSGVLAACGQQPAAHRRSPPSRPSPPKLPKPAAARRHHGARPGRRREARRSRQAGRRGQASAAGAASGGQVSIHWTKPVTFNTLYSTAGSEQGVERLMFGALVRVNDKLEAVPDLAEKIDVSPDAKTYTFTLKKGITFSDGKPLTSADVRFTYERAVDKRAAPTGAAGCSTFRGPPSTATSRPRRSPAWRPRTTTPSR